MKTINEIKRTTNLYYDSGVIEDEGRQIFQSDEDGYIYVLNTNTKRASRYNAEGLNGKRISVDEFESKLADMLLRIAKQEAEESANTEAGKKIELDMAMEELGYYPIDSEWNDIRYSTCDGQSKVMAWNTVEEGLTWANAMLDTKVKEPEPVNYCRHPEGTDLQKPVVFNQYGCVDCSKCNVQNCVHRDCMRRNPTCKGGLAECPRLKVKDSDTAGDGTPLTKVGKEIAEQAKKKAEKAKKERKPRKSKDIAYTYYTDDEHTNALFTLTAKQVDFLHKMVNTMAWDGFDHPLYVDLLVDEIGGQFAGKPMTVGAMISTLCEKGLGERETTRRDNHKCTSFSLTEMGQAVVIDLGL